MAIPQTPDVSMTMEMVRYHLERFELRQTFAPSVLEAMTLDKWAEYTGHLVYQLNGLVAKWEEERYMKTPADWWQHFKERWFPGWALKMWPVVYIEHDAAVILPGVPLPTPTHAPGRGLRAARPA